MPISDFPSAASAATQSIRRRTMMTSWKQLLRYWPFVRGIHRFPVNSPRKRPVTWSFDVFFDVHLNNRLNRHWWGWWFETPSCPLWRQCNAHDAEITSLLPFDLIIMLVLHCVPTRMLPNQFHTHWLFKWPHVGSQNLYSKRKHLWPILLMNITGG